MALCVVALIAASCSVDQLTDLADDSGIAGSGGSAGIIGSGGFLTGGIGGTAGSSGGAAGIADGGLDAMRDAGDSQADAGFVPSDILDLKIWLEADFSDIQTEANQAVSSWPNHGELGGSFDQTKNPERPTLGAFSGKPGLQFARNAPSSLRSNITPSALRFIHDGTGSTVISVFRPDMTTGFGVAWLTGGWFGTDTGSTAYYDAAGKRFVYYASGAAGTVLVGGTVGGGAPSPPSGIAYNVTTMLSATAANPLEMRVDGALAGSAAPTGPLGVALDPAYPFVIGTNGDETTKKNTALNGWVFAVLVYARRLSDAELGLVDAYLATKYQK